jgi:AraC family transcriptional regulator of adaptative response/methylated-DNA-[protein]-cysteine methyltransferase
MAKDNSLTIKERLMLHDVTQPHTLYMSWIETPLGPILAVADHTHVYLIEFGTCKNLDRYLEKLAKTTRSRLTEGTTEPITLLMRELDAYFKGTLTTFTVPLRMLGSAFQECVWRLLPTIAYGNTASYAHVATRLGNPKAYRAVARANATNRFVLVVPCHRVINSNGSLGGYNSGISYKQWLLEHEKNNRTSNR